MSVPQLTGPQSTELSRLGAVLESYYKLQSQKQFPSFKMHLNSEAAP